MDNIKVEFTNPRGPFGDATSSYDVVTNAKTVGEFIGACIHKDHFVTICLFKENVFKDNVCVAYSLKGEISRKANDYEEYAKMKISSIHANGGWGAMHYDICVKGKLKKQPRDEFEIVYWGYTHNK